jgi:hypothetical protein
VLYGGAAPSKFDEILVNEETAAIVEKHYQSHKEKTGQKSEQNYWERVISASPEFFSG